MALVQVLKSRGDTPKKEAPEKDFVERLGARMDVLLKGLQIAESVHGLVVTDEKDAVNRLRQAQAARIERQEKGITTPQERADLQAEGFEITDVERAPGPQPEAGRADPGFLGAKVAPGSTLLEGLRGQQFQAKFIGPPGKTPKGPGTRLVKDVMVKDPATGKMVPGQQIVTDEPGSFVGAEPGEDPQKKAKDINAETRALRKDYEGSSSTSTTKLTKRAIQEYNRLSKLIGSPEAEGGAKDIAIIKIFEKTLDPTSAIRESEFAIQRSAGAWDEQVKAWIGSIRSGQKLDAGMRQRILETARLDLMSRLEGQAIHDANWRKNIAANQLDIDADLVIDPLFAASQKVLAEELRKQRERNQAPGTTPGAGTTPEQKKRQERKDAVKQEVEKRGLDIFDRLRSLFD